jgi:hypothetical protein
MNEGEKGKSSVKGRRKKEEGEGSRNKFRVHKGGSTRGVEGKNEGGEGGRGRRRKRNEGEGRKEEGEGAISM